MSNLAAIVRKHGLNVHAYADENQLYKSCRPADVGITAHRLNAWLVNVDCWMSSNRLQLNPGKTELVWFGARQALQKLQRPSIILRDVVIKSSQSARCLGGELDEELKFTKHISIVCRSCQFQLRQLRHIRRYLDVDGAMTLKNAGSTIVMVYRCSVQKHCSTSSNLFLTKQSGPYCNCTDQSMFYVRWCSAYCTSCIFRRAWLTSCAR